MVVNCLLFVDRDNASSVGRRGGVVVDIRGENFSRRLDAVVDR